MISKLASGTSFLNKQYQLKAISNEFKAAVESKNKAKDGIHQWHALVAPAIGKP